MKRENSFYRRFGKRAFDLCFVVTSAPLLLPIGGVVALLVRLGLGTPVLFRQRRIGLDGEPFTLRKFRTMRDDRCGDGRLAPDEERLTRLGALLRRSSLDEIPEFLNVLSGEMSLVGPRPLLPEYLPLYSTRQARRHETPPGLTGLAQVRGRNIQSWKDRLESDVEYVERLSFALDLSILARTCRMIVTGHGVSAAGHATMPRFRGNDPRNDESPREPETMKSDSERKGART